MRHAPSRDKRKRARCRKSGSPRSCTSSSPSGRRRTGSPRGPRWWGVEEVVPGRLPGSRRRARGPPKGPPDEERLRAREAIAAEVKPDAELLQESVRRVLDADGSRPVTTIRAGGPRRRGGYRLVAFRGGRRLEAAQVRCPDLDESAAGSPAGAAPRRSRFCFGNGSPSETGDGTPERRRSTRDFSAAKRSMSVAGAEDDLRAGEVHGARLLSRAVAARSCVKTEGVQRGASKM